MTDDGRRPRPVRGSLFFPAFDACPDCHGSVGGASLLDLTVFLGTTCGSSRHVELGVVHRVAPPAAAAS